MEAAVAAQRGGKVRFVALHLQHSPIEDELKEAFARLLGSSAFTLGAEVERFEAEFAEYSHARHCVGVASGTAALSLMLEAYGIGPGDEVIVPAHTFIASALAVQHVGATPVICDVLEGTGLDRSRTRPGPLSARAPRRSSPSIFTGSRATWTRSTRSPGRAACLFSRTRRRRTGRPIAAAALARWATPRRSRSIRARTWALWATAARSAPTMTCWRPGCAGCATSGSGPRASTSSSATTSGLTGSKQRCCGSSSPISTAGTRRGGRMRRSIGSCSSRPCSWSRSGRRARPFTTCSRRGSRAATRSRGRSASTGSRPAFTTRPRSTSTRLGASSPLRHGAVPVRGGMGS